MKKALGTLVALGAAASWGVVYAFLDRVLEHLSPVASIIIFYFAGSLLLLPILPLYLDEISHEIRSAPIHLLLLAFAATLIGELLIFWSIKLLGGTEAGLIEITYPIFTALILYVMFGKTLTTATVIGGALALLGIAIMSIF